MADDKARLKTEESVPAYGEGLREAIIGELAVTQIKSNHPTPQPSQSIGYDEAYLIGLMVDPVPDHELWQDGRAVRTPSFRAGHTALYDLRRDPISFTRTAHHSLHFYLPRSAIVGIAESHGLKTDGELRYNFAQDYADPVIRHLGAAALAALESGGPMNGLFIDHLLQAAAVHVIQRYGETGPIRTTGGLSAHQLRRAQEVMKAHLSDELSLKRIASECGLSVTHFARAFRQSTGLAPYQWLQNMRLEEAKRLLAGHDRSLAEIAVACGFSDQSHFTRVFRKHVGESPGRWRRLFS